LAITTIFEHAANPIAPQAWHARTYGLLAQIGPTGFTIAPGAAATFRSRIGIHVDGLKPAGSTALSAAPL
jgi:hypothetical protein